MKKRIFASLLAMVMAFSLLPASALAARNQYTAEVYAVIVDANNKITGIDTLTRKNSSTYKTKGYPNSNIQWSWTPNSTTSSTKGSYTLSATINSNTNESALVAYPGNLWNYSSSYSFLGYTKQSYYPTVGDKVDAKLSGANTSDFYWEKDRGNSSFIATLTNISRQSVWYVFQDKTPAPSKDPEVTFQLFYVDQDLYCEDAPYGEKVKVSFKCQDSNCTGTGASHSMKISDVTALGVNNLSSKVKSGYTLIGWMKGVSAPRWQVTNYNKGFNQSGNTVIKTGDNEVIFLIAQKNKPQPQPTEWDKLTVTKTSSVSGTVEPGDEITYTITVTNNTGKDLTNVQVTDNLPDALTFVSASPEGQYVADTGLWTIPSLAAGATATLTITAKVKDNAAAGTISNTATITDAKSDDDELGEDGNSATSDVTVKDPEPVIPGDTKPNFHDADGKILVECTTDDRTHATAEKKYDLLDGSYDDNGSTVVNDVYYYSISLKRDVYVAKFSEDTGVTHTDSNPNDDTRIEWKWVDKQWQVVNGPDSALADIHCTCEGGTVTPPAEPTKADVKGNVTVKCINPTTGTDDCNKLGTVYSLAAGLAYRFDLTKIDDTHYTVTTTAEPYVKSFTGGKAPTAPKLAHDLYSSPELVWTLTWNETSGSWDCAPAEEGVDNLVLVTHAPSKWQEVGVIASGTGLKATCETSGLGPITYGLTTAFVYYDTDVVSVVYDENVGGYAATLKLDKYVDAIHTSCNSKRTDDDRNHRLTSGSETVTWILRVDKLDEESGKYVWKAVPKTDADGVFTVEHAMKVTFNPDNGEDSSTVQVFKGETVAQPADPVKRGYTFLGWFADGSEDAFNFTTPITGDLTLTAAWERLPGPAQDSKPSYSGLKVQVECVDNQSGHEDKGAYNYGLVIGLSDTSGFDELGITTENDEYYYTVKVNAEVYLEMYGKLTKVAHAEAEEAENTIVWQWNFEDQKWDLLNEKTSNGVVLRIAAKCLPTYSVTYKFASTDDTALPWNVLALLPTDEGAYNEGQEFIVAAAPTESVTFGDYTWTFQTWTMNGAPVAPGSKLNMAQGGLEIVGTWFRSSAQDNEYGVSYVYGADSALGTIPAEVQATLPVNRYTYSIGQKVTVAAAPADVTVGNYVWKFQGWHLSDMDGVEIVPNNQVEMTEGGLRFVGIWDREPLAPTDEDIRNALIALEKDVRVQCVTTENMHTEARYQAVIGLPENYELGDSFSYFEHTAYHVYLSTALFVSKYSEDTGAAHTAVETPEQLAWVVYWSGEEWRADPVDGGNLVKVQHELAPVSFAVTYNLNGGKATSGVSYTDETVSAGTEITVKAAPTRSGYTFKGWKAGETIYQPDAKLTVNADITFTAQWSKKSSSSDDDDNDYTLRYVTNGGKAISSESKSRSWVKDYEDLPVPTRVGYRFNGWYYDTKLTKAVTGDVQVSSRTVTLYAGWTENSVPAILNGDDHFAYIQGYDDGTVRPNTPVTRAQVATILFRLLDEDVRDEYLTETNTFTDVAADYWANTAISTMANLGVFKGRTADRFDPNAPITRGEFAAVCARFDDSSVQSSNAFSDIDGYWAKQEILRAAALGWVQGYQDGTFRPTASITRAQVVTMINRVLCRQPETASDLLKGMTTFTDCAEGDWCYLAIQEAANSHDYVGKSGSIYESWTDLNKSADWSKYEH